MTQSSMDGEARIRAVMVDAILFIKRLGEPGLRCLGFGRVTASKAACCVVSFSADLLK